MTIKKLILLTLCLPMLFACGSKQANGGLERYDFAYVGEWDTRFPEKQSMYIIRDGKVDWEFHLPLYNSEGRIQEFDDITVMPNGNIAFAAMSVIGVIDPKTKKFVWRFDCPVGTESHSCQPIDDKTVVFALNGVPGKIMIWDIEQNLMLKEIIVPTQGTNTHGQFRHVRMTKDGTFTTGLLTERKAVEIDEQGQILWSVDAPAAWAVLKLNNGNYLISGDSRGYTREVDKDGHTVWELTQQDVPFKLYNTQTATRLANGNTVITNWVAGQPEDTWAGSVQLFEVTKDKEVVWQLSSWDNPDLGPCTYLHILDKKAMGYFDQQR